MARYCVAFETMKKLKEATKAESLNEMVRNKLTLNLFIAGM